MMNASNRNVADDRDLLDPASLRHALGCFATGIVVVTTLDGDGRPVGLTVNSFNSVSMSPPLVLWSLSLGSPSLAAFRGHPSFVINVLAESQLDICMQFARPGEDKFAGVAWEPGLSGVPVLAGTVATLECRNYRQYEGGDHEIFLGEVKALSSREKPPLIFNRGKFGTLFGEL